MAGEFIPAVVPPCLHTCSVATASVVAYVSSKSVRAKILTDLSCAAKAAETGKGREIRRACYRHLAASVA